MGIVNQKVTSYNYQYIEIKFDFIPSYAILNFYLINNQNYNFYGNVIIFDDISLNNNILSISQASSYNYYVQGVVF